jgi:hypothetical protein
MSKSRLAKRVKLDVGSPFDVAAQGNSRDSRRGHNVNQKRGDRKAEEGAMKAQIRGMCHGMSYLSSAEWNRYEP